MYTLLKCVPLYDAILSNTFYAISVFRLYIYIKGNRKTYNDV